ncbi:EcsC family protein [Niallia circulans]|jgi:ribosomal protein S17E|uniref:EcsC family protein n=1 Tax=Niallia TaxID=2837506 RepID=UPI00077C17D1|nr:EcsC family protein [Niallia circulans]MCM2982737.1 EcsC family protein [Niallia circulans]MDR4315990.1 EcsC family protein [Niallia circulans]MED3837676.1 EcsC family protein [Niallia circulans]MED4244746.1 EcsC family protein [Niallia circulans]MED4249770.1 EcsC family protein [Niallia circulans]
MNEYEQRALKEVEEWKRKIQKRSSILNRVSKKAQNKINSYIPDKVHQTLTEAIKQMIQATLAGSNIIKKKNPPIFRSLQGKDEELTKKISQFQKVAVVEGAGTGAGGILLGLADFPLLLSIKMNFLMEAAATYGYDTAQVEERIYLLYIFQLAFSSEGKRREVLEIIENWEEEKHRVASLNWQDLQQEYRDFIDFVKMLQLVPGIGAAVGAYANYNLMDQLGEAAKNVYRWRYFQEQNK